MSTHYLFLLTIINLFTTEMYFLMKDSVTHEDLALVLLGGWVDVGDHGCGVGHEDSVHQTAGYHADHDDPHLNIIWGTRHRAFYI